MLMQGPAIVIEIHISEFSRNADNEFMQGSDSEPEIVQGLSGDEVDVSNIVQGGRRARRGRAQSAHEQIQKYKQKAQDSDEDSW